MIDYYNNQMYLVLPGAGFLASYYIGAISILMQVWPKHPFAKISGTSSGGIIAASIAAGVPLARIVSLWCKLVICSRETFFSPFKRKMKDKLHECLDQGLPARAHETVSGRIGISITKLSDFSNIVATHFATRSDLIDAIIAGSYIPWWSGLGRPPTYLGIDCMDGGFTGNLPMFEFDQCDLTNGVRHVVMYPLAGQVDVCPDDGYITRTVAFLRIELYFTLKNFYRAMFFMIPMQPKSFTKFFRQGHNDMKRYLMENGLLKCRHCYKFTQYPLECFLKEELRPIYEVKFERKACLECLLLLEKVSNLSIPDEIISAISNDRK